MYYELTDHFVVSADLAQTWDFFSRADNLPLITPPWLGFKVVAQGPIRMARDTLLDYTIRWMGVPVKWRTKIIDWSPPRQFIDLQVKGPYALWLHQHTFTQTPEGVECTDRIIYRLPVPVVSRVIHSAVVGRQLREIFRFRRNVIGGRLGWVRAVQEDVEIRGLR